MSRGRVFGLFLVLGALSAGAAFASWPQGFQNRGPFPIVPPASSGGTTDYPTEYPGVHVAADTQNGGVFVAGMFQGTVDFAPSENLIEDTRTSSRGDRPDIYLLKYDRRGVLEWVVTGGQFVTPPLPDHYMRLAGGGRQIRPNGHSAAHNDPDNPHRDPDHAPTTHTVTGRALVYNEFKNQVCVVGTFRGFIKFGGLERQNTLATAFVACLDATLREWKRFDRGANAVTGDSRLLAFEAPVDIALDGANQKLYVAGFRHELNLGSSQRWGGTLQRFDLDPEDSQSESRGVMAYRQLRNAPPLPTIDFVAAAPDILIFGWYEEDESGECQDGCTEIYRVAPTIAAVGQDQLAQMKIWATSLQGHWTSALISGGSLYLAKGDAIARWGLDDGMKESEVPMVEGGDPSYRTTLAADPAGNIYQAFRRPCSFQVRKWQDDLNEVWVSDNLIELHCELGEEGVSLAVGDDRNVYLAGSFDFDLAQDGEKVITHDDTGGNPNHFVHTLDRAGGLWFKLEEWTAGQEILRPTGAQEGVEPQVELPTGSPAGADHFYWDAATGKYYAVRPVSDAIVKWENTGTEVCNPPDDESGCIRLNGRIDWPESPQLHVAGASVVLEPPGVGASFEEVRYAEDSEGTALALEAGSVFRRNELGFSVLRYRRNGETVFEVVETVGPADDELEPCNAGVFHYSVAVDVPVSQTDPSLCHDDPGGGFVYAVLPSPVDAEIWDNDARAGQFVPVNAKTIEVIAYTTDTPSGLAVGWPDTRTSLTATWPENTGKIVIDELVGSEYDGQPILDPVVFPEARLYVQNDPEALGFNPNEEHALIAPANPAFALQSDSLTFKEESTAEVLNFSQRIELEQSDAMLVSSEVSFDASTRQISLPEGSGDDLADFDGLTRLELTYTNTCDLSGSQPGICRKDASISCTSDAACDDLNPNRGPYTIDAVSDNTLTVAEPLVSESPGTGVSVTLTGRGNFRLTTESPHVDLSIFTGFEKLNMVFSSTNSRLYTILSVSAQRITVKEPVTPGGNFSKLQAARDSGRIVSTTEDLSAFAGSVRLTVLGSTEMNDGVYDVESVTANEIVVSRPFTAEAAGAEVTLRGTRPSGSGFPAVFALQRQQDFSASEPYVILKHRDPAETTRWKHKVYQVVESEAGDHSFEYSILAGTPVPRPYPLSLLGGCPDTAPEDVAGSPSWQDVRGNVYARADGVMLVDYFYPLQASFYHDPEGAGRNTGQPGDCVRWLEEPPGTPKLVRYEVDWPQNTPVLRVGETLLQAKRGLPQILDQAAVEVVFEGSDTGLIVNEPSVEFSEPLHLAKLFDPLSTRWVDVDDFDPDRFRDVIKKAPFHLRLRLDHDPILSRLGFKGYLDDSLLGDPLLLINVMSERERDLLTDLCASDFLCEDGFDDLYHKTRNPLGLDLNEDGHPDQDLLIGLRNDDAPFDKPETLRLVGQPGALSAGAARGTGYLTLAFNNDPSLQGAPVSLEPIKIECGAGPYLGSIQVMPTDNVFDERLTLRHSGDFGGEPESFEFAWYRKSPPDYNPSQTDIPPNNAWIGERGPEAGLVDITIEGADPITISDNFYFVKYTPEMDVNVCGASQWAGDPSGTQDEPRAKLGEGWIKRVVRGLNPFRTRSTDFHAGPVNTYSSMLIQAGAPYDGPIAFNGAPEAVNSIGLIEAYETVLRRGIQLALCDACTTSEAANTALLLAATRIADLYVLLGHEASSDATDPTIGFGTESGEFGSLAPSIFAFQNQLPTLLDEELALLRGRDGSGAAVNLGPVFNRLIHNFTSGEGEVAYSQVYDIRDRNADGVIDEADARIQIPQGHGDAWGHYLTALKRYYDLLRHDRYTWKPRAEQVNVAGTAVTVDFLDERKLAAAAAALAKTGAEIAALTYRKEYVEDPGGQWQGYKDPDPERAWGVDEWARRAGQGALFNWITANALLPDEWDPAEQGARGCSPTLPVAECPTAPADPEIGRIDRTNVPELAEIATHYGEIQAQIDKADAGLNPLGLAKGVVPFDIDPSRVDAGETHFEQIFDRAKNALRNTVAVFDHASRLSQSLRRNQDTLDDFAANVEERERDFINRMIEIFGTPYSDDIGGGGEYPADYDGPDLFHYMYVDRFELEGRLTGAAIEAGEIEGFFTSHAELGFSPVGSDEFETETDDDGKEFLRVTYHVDPDLGLVKPPEWTGARRAPGELQRVLSDLYRNQASFDQARRSYDNKVGEITTAAEGLGKTRKSFEDEVRITREGLLEQQRLSEGILVAQNAAIAFSRTAFIHEQTAESVLEAIPKSVGVANDAFAPSRGIVKNTSNALMFSLALLEDAANISINGLELAKENAESQTEIDLLRDTTNEVENRQIRELARLFRELPVLHLEAVQRGEALAQTGRLYQTTLFKGLQIADELAAFRAKTAANIQQYRYQDMAFRIARNDALQKYRAQFDLAARYAYLAATAYDYETNLLGTSGGAGRDFLTDIVKHRSLGELVGGEPVIGSRGLADPLARMGFNFDVLKGQMGFNNPQTETNRFSLRREFARKTTMGDGVDAEWQSELEKYRVDLWDLPEWRRFARPFAPEPGCPAGEPDCVKEPALVIGYSGMGGRPLTTTVTAGLNFFTWPLGPGDSFYSSSNFATKIRSVGVWFENYDQAGLAQTPRVYLLPVGADVLRPPTAGDFRTREWQVVDQVIPVPFPIGATDLDDPEWIPLADSLGGELGGIRRMGDFRAHSIAPGDESFNPSQFETDSRLIGRSVWNGKWLLVIPGRSLLADPDEGIEKFLEHVTDVKLFFQTYAYSGN